MDNLIFTTDIKLKILDTKSFVRVHFNCIDDDVIIKGAVIHMKSGPIEHLWAVHESSFNWIKDNYWSTLVLAAADRIKTMREDEYIETEESGLGNV